MSKIILSAKDSKVEEYFQLDNQLTSILKEIKIPDKYQNDIFLNNKIIFASKIHTSEKILHRFYRKIEYLNDTNFAKRNFTVPLTIKPKIKIELYSYLKEKFPDYHIKDSNQIVYPKNHGFMGWHTNFYQPANRLYLNYAEESNKSFFRYYDNNSKKIVTLYDKKGWQARVFYLCKEKPLWHCVYSETPRISLGFRIVKKK